MDGKRKNDIDTAAEVIVLLLQAGCLYLAFAIITQLMTQSFDAWSKVGGGP